MFLVSERELQQRRQVLIGAGLHFIKKKQEKKKKKKLFCFHHHHRPIRRHYDADLQERGKKSRFLLSLLSIGSFRFRKISKTFQKGKKFHCKSKKILCKAIRNSKFKVNVKKSLKQCKLEFLKHIIFSLVSTILPPPSPLPPPPFPSPYIKLAPLFMF